MVPVSAIPVDSSGAMGVLVGGAEGAQGFAAARYRSILWLVDSVGALRPLRGVGNAAVTTVVLDQLAAHAVVPVLERFRRHDPFGWPDLFVSRDPELDAAGPYADALVQVRAWFALAQTDRHRAQRMGFRRQKNFLLNVTTYAQRRLPAAWAGALRGLPAFVCGAGPSLDVSAATLARVADRGVVIAADSALRALARHGVRADFAVSISSRKQPEHCLAPGTDPARMILASCSPAGWREAIASERVCFLSCAHPTEDWLAGMGVAAAPLRAAENVGITALEFARFLGCAPIHLFGLDLAVDPAASQMTHSVDTDLAIEREDAPGVASLPRVPGNYAVDVPTQHHADWSACDARLAACPAGLVINVTDRGARLRNTRVVHPRQFDCVGSTTRRALLAHLPAPDAGDVGAVRHALTSLGAQGALGCRMVGDWRTLRAREGAAAMAMELRRALAATDLARALGSFAQKMLLPGSTAVAPADAYWDEALDEFEELCCLAEAVYGAPVA